MSYRVSQLIRTDHALELQVVWFKLFTHQFKYKCIPAAVTELWRPVNMTKVFILWLSTYYRIHFNYFVTNLWLIHIFPVLISRRVNQEMAGYRGKKRALTNFSKPVTPWDQCLSSYWLFLKIITHTNIMSVPVHDTKSCYIISYVAFCASFKHFKTTNCLLILFFT